MCEIGDTLPVVIEDVEHQIDRCIAPLINEMNKVGIKTIECCCGHFEGKIMIFIDGGDMRIDLMLPPRTRK